MKTQKTKKSFKKKALLSSLSMLMVATVAVGSATFAWFTQSPTASAKGLTMKATSQNGLKIRTESRANSQTEDADTTSFLSTDTLNYTKAVGQNAKTGDTLYLDPVSMAFKTDGTTAIGDATPYYTTAAGDGASTADPYAIVDKLTSRPTWNNGKFYEEDIECKLVGVTDTTTTATIKLNDLNVVIPDSASELKESIRILISYDGIVKGAYALNNDSNLAISGVTPTTQDQVDTNTETIHYIKDANQYINADKSTTVTFGSWTSVGNTADSALELGDITAASTKNVTVSIYLDGEDNKCFASNINLSNIISEVEVSLTIAELT